MTEEALENFLDTMSGLEVNEENKNTIKQPKKSLEYLEIAISERYDEMISAKKRLKEMLCN